MSSDPCTIITNAIVVTVDDKGTIFEPGFVAWSGSTIVAVGPMSAFPFADPDRQDTIIDGSNHIVMPGLVNGHCHTPMVLLRGYSDDVGLETWLHRDIWPIEGILCKEPESMRIGSSLAMVEMLKSGVTMFVDMYFHMHEVAKVCEKAGIRAMLGEGLFSYFPGPAGTTVDDFEKKLLTPYKDHPTITPCYAPHGTYTCSPEFLKDIKRRAREHDVVFSIHCCETETEVATVRKFQGGKSPVELLEDIGALDEKTILAHCVVLTDADREILRRRRPGIIHCPKSNMKLSSGNFQWEEIVSKDPGARVALGTDGASSNNTLDIFNEMRTAALLHKVALAKKPTVASAAEIVKMATIGGARALGMDDRIGSLEKGKLADLIMVDISAPHCVPLYDALSHLVYACDARDVDNVVVNGKLVVKDHKILTMSEADVVREAAVLGERIKKLKVELAKKAAAAAEKPSE